MSKTASEMVCAVCRKEVSEVSGAPYCFYCGEWCKAVAAKTVQATKPAWRKPAQAKPQRKRCPHYVGIKEFFSVAREMGLDTTKKEACRAAVGMLLGRRVVSRANLTGAEWSFCTNALRNNRLFW